MAISSCLLAIPFGALAGPIGTNSHPLPEKLFTTGSTTGAFRDDRSSRTVAISADGNTLVLGAPFDSSIATNAGAAYVFVRSGSRWIEQQKLTAGDPSTNDYFGTSVAIEGDTIVIGAEKEGTSSTTIGGKGRVYVFRRGGITWTQQQKLVATSPTVWDDLFGHSVEISGDSIAIGAPAELAAYVFTRPNASGVWAQQQRLAPSVTDCGEYFGWDVAIAGHTLLIGAPQFGLHEGTNCGAAYVFARSGSIWMEQQRLTGNTNIVLPQFGELVTRFGHSVTLDGDTLVVGAPLESRSAESQDWFKGAAYVFVRSGGAGSWSLQQKLMPPDLMREDFFGQSLALAGNTLAMGARAFTANNTDAGEVHIFERTGTNWSRAQKLRATDLINRDSFGRSIALSSGGTLAARSFPTNNEITYVYEREDDLWSPWKGLDIGPVAAAGTESFSNGTFRVTGSGQDIWETSDEFRFTYRPLTGDGEIRARVVSMDNTDPWAKAGVMFAERLDAPSRKALAFVTPVNGSGFQWRATPGGTTTFTPATPFASAPLWLRLVRSNNTFTSYHSPDGVVWRQIDQQTITMTNSVYVGLAVTSHRDGTLCTAVFDNVADNEPLPSISNVSRQSDGSFRMTVNGEIGRTYTLHGSTDLINWSSVTSWVITSRMTTVSDPQAATLQRRFYRVAETQ